MPIIAEPHDMVWDRTTSGRFWDYMSTKTSGYFSQQVGRSVVRMARRTLGRVPGRVLDYGCGPGYLMEHLLHSGTPCEGADFSADSLEVVARKFHGHPLFRGIQLLERIPSGLPDAAYDLVYFVETIEHVLPEELETTLAELERIVRPGGHIVVTTPHDELLDKRMVICPECSCVFHRVQHMTSWTPSSLSRVMYSVGFKTVVSRPVFFTRESLLWRAAALGWRFTGQKLPHLFYVGRKLAE